MRRFSHLRASRRGMTLIEMLIAIAISLLVLLAVISVFDQLNTAMSASKAIIEQAGELRNVTLRLQADLDGHTASTLPWSIGGDGYTEYVDGPVRDLSQPPTQSGSYWGDFDDVLMLTSRSRGKPFVGRYDPDGPAGPQPAQLIESELAEIIWWTRTLGDFNGSGAAGDTPAEVAVYRRVLLIRPDLNVDGKVMQAGTDLTQASATMAAFFQNNDVSVSIRNDGTTYFLTANTLADLNLRQNRAFHSVTFPHALDIASLLPIAPGHVDEGTDMVLNKVAAFDVRVYDPLAPIRAGAGGMALSPGDVGWAGSTTMIGRGAFVDLNYAGDPTVSFYSGPPNPVSRPPLNATLDTLPNYSTYSTWPEAYEHDGINQDQDFVGTDPLIDEGRDGFDTPGGLTTAADDPGESETFPPYPHVINGEKMPGLRGIQVRIRLVEADSRQVRQATVVSDFLPE